MPFLTANTENPNWKLVFGLCHFCLLQHHQYIFQIYPKWQFC